MCSEFSRAKFSKNDGLLASTWNPVGLTLVLAKSKINKS
jgi:hypothetical protein